METQFKLRKFVAPEIIFGVGARNLAGEYSQKYGLKKVLLVTDSNLMNYRWVNDVVESLEICGVKSVIYKNVSPNPREQEVMQGSDLYQLEQCDGIVSVGGGSPMDAAKGIAIVVSNGGDILDYKGVDMITRAVPPLILIPTTAGTSADISQFTIITDTLNKVKVAIISKNIVPDVALIDSETTSTMDTYLTACTGVDAMVHAIEAYVSKASSPMTDLHALEAIKTINKYLPLAIRDPENILYREKMMYASMEAGLAFSNAILGAVHAMAHSLGGLLDLPHGECNALLLNHVVDYNYDIISNKYNDISESLNININKYDKKDKKIILLDKIVQFKESVGIIKSLKLVGVKDENISELAAKSVKDACILTNPKKATKEDIISVFKNAM